MASVSCIYGIGSPDAYLASSIIVKLGDVLNRREFLLHLTEMQYLRNDISLQRSTFRVKGDVIELQPAYEETALRIETFGDQIEAIRKINPVSGKVIGELEEVTIFPAKHYMTTGITMDEAVGQIGTELSEQLEKFRSQNKLVEAQRLEQRTSTIWRCSKRWDTLMELKTTPEY